jgi:RNA-binding protein
MEEELRGKQRRYLRGLGNELKAMVYMGREGISEGLLQSLEEVYTHHELIKVKVERNCPLDRREAGQRLAEASNSHLVQVLGYTVLLYRPDPEEPQIQLPA